MFRLFAVLVLFVAVSPVHAGTFSLKPESAEVSFDAVGRPSALRIHGVGKKLSLLLDRSSEKLAGAIEFPLESLDSGITLRDRHMKEKYLEVGKFPTARLELVQVKLPASITASEEKVPVVGKLTLHGVTLPVEAVATVQKKDEGVLVKAEFSTKLSQYGIEIPKFAGITVAEDVSIHVVFVALEN